MPTARAAQAAGLILFFVMMFAGGAGPPQDVLTAPLSTIGRGTPLWHVITLLQDPWLRGEWDLPAAILVVAIVVVSVVVASRLYRRP